MSTKTTHSWTWLGRSLTSPKQSLKHHQLSPNNYTRQHVYLRTPPRREHRMLFAEIDSQGGRSTPTSLQSTPFSSQHTTSFALAQQAVVRDLWIWRTPVARRALSHPPVRTEHTPMDQTHTPLDFPLSGAQLHLSAGPHLPTPHDTPAHGWPHAKPASLLRLLLLPLHSPRVWGSSQPLLPLQSWCRFPAWTSTPLSTSSSLALDVRVSP